MIGKLLMKEFKGTIGLTVGACLILMVVGNWYLRSCIGVWPDTTVMHWAATQLVLIFPWCVAMSFYVLYSEWNTHTVVLLLSLPVRGVTVIAVKAFAILGGFVCLYGIGMVNFLSYLRRLTKVPVLERVFGAEFFFLCIMLEVLIGLTQLAFLLSRKFRKFPSAVMCGLFWAELWLLKKGVRLLMPFCDLVARKLQITPLEVHTVAENGLSLVGKKASLMHFLIGILLMGALWFGNGWLLEKSAEL